MMIHVILSQAGIASLAASGISIGWLSAWLYSAGAGRVRCYLHGDAWDHTEADWRICIATTDELRFMSQDYAMDPDTCHHVSLENPVRSAWYNRLENQTGSVLFLPAGDVAYQRHIWLAIVNQHKDLLPFYVWTGDTGGMALEAGLRGSLVLGDQPASATMLNTKGQLPEEQAYALLCYHKIGIRFAESCTAGGISERLSRLPGVSSVLDCAWITYSNAAKHELLHVPQALLDEYGAVSQKVVESMAAGGCDAAHACVAVSGIAGPGGGAASKPVGTVWIALALPDGKTHVICHHGTGSRADIRQQTIHQALGLLIGVLSDKH